MTRPTPAAVRFEIRRITLHGYSPGQGAQFLGALRAELTALAQSRDWPAAAAASVDRLDAGTLAAGDGPAAAACVAARIDSTLTLAGAGARAGARR